MSTRLRRWVPLLFAAVMGAISVGGAQISADRPRDHQAQPPGGGAEETSGLSKREMGELMATWGAVRGGNFAALV